MTNLPTPPLSAEETLRAMFNEHKTLYGVIVKVAAGGMSRDIKHFTVFNGTVRNIDHLIVSVCPELKLNKDFTAITRKGCGVNFIDDATQRLSIALYGDRNVLGYKLL